MRRTCALTFLAAVALAAGCSAAARREADKATFDRLYGEYRQRVYDAVERDVEKMTDADVFNLAEKTWKDVFGNHTDLLRRMAEAELASLPTAHPPDPERYDVQEARRLFVNFRFPTAGRSCSSHLYGPIEAVRDGEWAASRKRVEIGW